MTNLQRRITINSAICGTIVAVFVVLLDAGGVLRSLEWWLYDKRAATCQYFTPPPSSEIVHLDIDDEALDRNAVGSFPWKRSVWAAILDEVRLAGPKAVAIDVLFAEPQAITNVKVADHTYREVDEDASLVESLRKLQSPILGASLEFTNGATEHGTTLHMAAVEELKKDLTLSHDDLIARLVARGFKGSDIAVRINVDYADMIREAIHDAIRDRLMADRQLSASDLERLLLHTSNHEPPASTQSTTVPTERISRFSPLVQSIYQTVIAEMNLRRFSLPLPTGLRNPAPDAVIKLPPLPEYSSVIAGCGFTDYDIFTEPVVRAVPLFVNYDDRLYPQFALALACRLVDADVTTAKITDDFVTIPAPNGEIRIPVRSRYSASVRRYVGGLMDIPFFGGPDWQTMYDWPKYRTVMRHTSINVAWDIVDARRKLAHNNEELDAGLFNLLGDVRGAEYVNRHLDPEDGATRRQVAEKTLADRKEDGYDEEFFKKVPDAELKDDERKIKVAMTAVKSILEQNSYLEERIKKKRKELADLIHDKGVLIGWTATGATDMVPTSLHARCPGVVVHGVIVNAILNRDFLRTAPRVYTVLLTLLFGLLTTALTSRMPPARAVPFLMLLAGAYFVANGLLFYDRLNIIVSAAAPMVAIGACWAACMIVRLVLEGLERIRREKEAAVISHEINLARQVQQALIPKQLTILTNIESHGWTLAATTTGGDCFDLWKMADGRLGILVADASGHGLGPSILVTEVRALVRGLCDLYQEPQKLLERVNQRLASDLDGSKFVTAFVAFVSEDGKLSWGSAGHGPMLLSDTPDAAPKELEATGLPLGVSEDWFGEENVPAVRLEPGGWLMVVSDGIFEAPNPTGEQFEIGRVKQTVQDLRTTSCEQVVTKLRQAVHKWQAKDEPHDDQTIVLIRRSSAPTPAATSAGADNGTPATTGAASSVVSS